MIGKTLKKIRKIKNFSKDTVATCCEISVEDLRKIENDVLIIDEKLLEKFGAALEVPLSILTFINFDENEVNFKEEYLKMKPVVEKLLINIVKHRKK